MKRIGYILIAIGTLILIGTYYPVLIAQVRYLFYSPPDDYVVLTQEQAEQTSGTAIIPRDEEFGIVIPKINANAPIVAHVDPYDAPSYQEALSRGVAHADGTSVPGKPGSVFLFAHSATDFYRASQYNAIFYLIDRLENNDEIYVFYKGDRYKYEVIDTKLVEASDVSYLTTPSKDNVLYLMTCWPAGTTLKRFIIEAEIVS